MVNYRKEWYSWQMNKRTIAILTSAENDPWMSTGTVIN